MAERVPAAHGKTATLGVRVKIVLGPLSLDEVPAHVLKVGSTWMESISTECWHPISKDFGVVSRPRCWPVRHQVGGQLRFAGLRVLAAIGVLQDFGREHQRLGARCNAVSA